MDVKLAAAVADDELNVRAFCRRHGISPSTFYKWRKRFREHGLDGLQELSRRPLTSPSLLASTVEDAIVAARKALLDDGWDAGADSILDRLERDGQLQLPSRASIWRVLRRRGQVVDQPSKRPKSSVWKRFEWGRPNDCWQIDATHWTLTGGTVIEIINIIDDHSRVLVSSVAVPVTTSPAAWAAFMTGAQRWGLPGHVLSDNGLAFTARRHRNDVAFAANLRSVGIRPINSTPRHPQTCGKVERFHQTLKLWLAQHPAASIRELQTLLDTFAEHYNTVRPHRACHRRPPITKWEATVPAGPADHPVDEPVHIVATTVDKRGYIEVRDYAIAVGTRWAGNPVTVIIQARHAVVFHHHTVVRQLDINPDRRVQPIYPKPGRPPR
jgi:transposase InsO family protein